MDRHWLDVRCRSLKLGVKTNGNALDMDRENVPAIAKPINIVKKAFFSSGKSQTLRR